MNFRSGHLIFIMQRSNLGSVAVRIPVNANEEAFSLHLDTFALVCLFSDPSLVLQGILLGLKDEEDKRESARLHEEFDALRSAFVSKVGAWKFVGSCVCFGRRPFLCTLIP